MTQVTHTQLFINGRWQPSQSGEEYAIYNPARPDELVGYAGNANAADIDR